MEYMYALSRTTEFGAELNRGLRGSPLAIVVPYSNCQYHIFGMVSWSPSVSIFCLYSKWKEKETPYQGRSQGPKDGCVQMTSILS